MREKCTVIVPAKYPDLSYTCNEFAISFENISSLNLAEREQNRHNNTVDI